MFLFVGIVINVLDYGTVMNEKVCNRGVKRLYRGE